MLSQEETVRGFPKGVSVKSLGVSLGDRAASLR